MSTPIRTPLVIIADVGFKKKKGFVGTALPSSVEFAEVNRCALVRMMQVEGEERENAQNMERKREPNPWHFLLKLAALLQGTIRTFGVICIVATNGNDLSGSLPVLGRVKSHLLLDRQLKKFSASGRSNAATAVPWRI